ncbi:uncharacterized protein LOC116384707 [Anarrhichthys ocellatus]|uniref:uncharacterized protein LOC116384707 n=1 Tax=Anarrhichthys ocellatus TaxID=433405 RepID=UPI0012ED3DC9|nr:uncharacterized protein LOC116384707 [Anarrhichthys ocellatus]
MNKVTLIFLALFAPGLAQCFPVTASQGRNRSPQLFFCNISGCAFDMTHVYCNDVDLMNQTGIADCTGPPPPNTVCRHGGRAFFSIDTDGVCEFEGKSGYIVTEKCTDQSNICAFISANISSQVATEDHARHRYIVVGVCGSALIILIGTFWYIHSRWIVQSRGRNQQPARDYTAIPLREMESPGETSDNDTPGSADGSSTSHRDRGA